MRNVSNVMTIMLALSCGSAFAAEGSGSNAPAAASQGRSTPSPENTGINARDKGGETKTPQKQVNAESDRKLLAEVRRAVVNDKTLSTAAHNVKIVALDQVVTLRGPVRNSDEKVKIGKIVQQVAGVSSVDNQLDISTK